MATPSRHETPWLGVSGTKRSLDAYTGFGLLSLDVVDNLFENPPTCHCCLEQYLILPGCNPQVLREALQADIGLEGYQGKTAPGSILTFVGFPWISEPGPTVISMGGTNSAPTAELGEKFSDQKLSEFPNPCTVKPM